MPRKVAVGKVPSTFFYTRKLSPSTENLRTIMNRKTWPSLSPLRASAVVAESALMVRFHKEGRLPDLANTWRTRFLQRGLVVKDKNKPQELFFSLGPWPTCAAAQPRWLSVWPRTNTGVLRFRSLRPRTRRTVESQ